MGKVLSGIHMVAYSSVIHTLIYSKKTEATYCDESLWDYVTAGSIEHPILSPCARSCHCIRMWPCLKKTESGQCSLMYVCSGQQEQWWRVWCMEWGVWCTEYSGNYAHYVQYVGCFETRWEEMLRAWLYMCTSEERDVGESACFRDERERAVHLVRSACTHTMQARAHAHTRAHAYNYEDTVSLLTTHSPYHAPLSKECQQFLEFKPSTSLTIDERHW